MELGCWKHLFDQMILQEYQKEYFSSGFLLALESLA